MSYNLDFSNQAKKEISFLKKNDNSSFKKLTKLLNELQEHPASSTGKPKPLKGNLTLLVKTVAK